MSIRFPIAEITPRLRAAGGVRGMDLRSRTRDRIIYMGVVNPRGKLLVISRRGYGKLTSLNRYRAQSRGGLGVKTFSITRKTGPVAAAEVVDDTQQVYVVSEQAQVLLTSLSEISSTGRITQGVTIFKPDTGDSVSSIACVDDLKHVDENEPPAQSDDNRRGNNGRVSGK
jgi:DNA gyrase subunit A